MIAQRYSVAQRLIHWATALVVICALAAGLTIGLLGGFNGVNETFGQPTTNLIYKYHKTAGVIILGLMALRVLFWVIYGRPPAPADMPAWERVASTGTHLLLYIWVISMAVVGWMATASGGFPVEFFDMKLPGLIGRDKELSAFLYQIHEILGWVLLGFVVLHILAAMRHWLVRKDGVMARMSLF